MYKKYTIRVTIKPIYKHEPDASIGYMKNAPFILDGQIKRTSWSGECPKNPDFLFPTRLIAKIYGTEWIDRIMSNKFYILSQEIVEVLV